MKVLGNIAAAVGLLCLPSAAQPRQQVLTRIIDVHSLPAGRAAEAYPVSVEGIVTQTMPEWNGFALQDSTDAVYVSVVAAHPVLPSIGQRVEVRGHTDAGNFAPLIRGDAIRILGPGSFPKPAHIDWKTLSSGACDNDYVEVEGVVRSASPVQPPRWRWPATEIHIDLGGNLVWAYVRDATNLKTAELPGSSVRVRGTCLVLSNARRQFERNALLVANASGVDIVEPALRDPFSLPLSSLNHLFAFRPGVLVSQPGVGAQLHRVRINGTVTGVDGTRLFLQEGDYALQVRTATRSAVRVGQCLDVVGFPAPGPYSSLLEDAIFRPCSSPQPVVPIDVKAANILSRTQDNRPALPDATLIRVAATVLDVSRSAQDQVLTLEDGDSVFAARLHRQRGAPVTLAIPEGSRVTLTGVCLIQVDESAVPRAFELLLRSPDDVHIVSRPSWLTRSVALKSAAILLIAALSGVLWIVFLRRRVRAQTATIEEQLRREAALQSRVRELVEHASDMVYIVDLQGKLLHVNDGTERLTGYTRQQLLGQSLFPLLVPEQRELARRSLAFHPSHPTSGFQQAEWRFLRKDGSEITVEVSQRFQADAQGQIRVEAIGRDVTARKQAMFEDQERFRTLADNIPQLAWMADASGSTIWYNQRWFEYTGSTLDQVRNWGWVDYHHPDHVDRIATGLRHSFKTGESWEDTFPLRGGDGQFRWFLGRALPISDNTGQVVRWFGTNTDITEQKQVESELQRSNEDLRQFAYIASHDLQEPLRNVCSFAQLLSRTFQNGDLSPQRRQYIEIISNGARRMEALISDLLAYSRATATQDIQRTATSMESVFASTIQNLEAGILQSLATITHDPLPTLHVNPVHMGQVLQNLFGNSIKYGRPGIPPRIHLRATRQVDSWLFAVEDNGAGFKPEYATRVFGIFKRLHGQEVPGTGIGLAICKAIVERHGGQIWAEGKPDAGATFYFTIPDLPSSSDAASTAGHQRTTKTGVR